MVGFLFEWPHKTGFTVIKKYCIVLSEDLFNLYNSVDPDEMQHYVAFHLGLHCWKRLGRKAQLVTYLATDASLTADPGVAS